MAATPPEGSAIPAADVIPHKHRQAPIHQSHVSFVQTPENIRGGVTNFTTGDQWSGGMKSYDIKKKKPA